jgi:acyl-CoA hydrolase
MGSSLPAPPARRVEASMTTMTEYVLPTHANIHGNVFGGQILAWVDLCAAICAQRHTGQTAITVCIDELQFQRSIKIGQVVILKARMTAAFRTSVEILVEVEGEEATTGVRWPCVSAFVSFVAMDQNRVPVTVPPLELVTAEEHALAAAAQGRREQRLKRRKVPK